MTARSNFVGAYTRRPVVSHSHDPRAVMTARSNFFEAYARRPVVSHSLTARQSFAQRSDAFPRKETHCIGECYNKSATIQGALDCVDENCVGENCEDENDCGWNCDNFPREMDRENLCEQRCRNVQGFTYEPGCGGDGPPDCMYDKHLSCKRLCRQVCD
jgi:hypothetical protein